jgi:hypothetical protein
MKLFPCAFSPALAVDEALGLSANFSSAATLPEKTSEIRLGYSGPISSYRTDFLFGYDIFPRFLMRAEAQRVREGRAMRVGDIIVQRDVLPPIRFGLCAEFAVRVSALITQPSKLGFAYQTLAGHLERGVSGFYFEERTGALFFVSHLLRASALALTTRQSFFARVSEVVHAAGAQTCEATLCELQPKHLTYRWSERPPVVHLHFS